MGGPPITTPLPEISAGACLLQGLVRSGLRMVAKILTTELPMTFKAGSTGVVGLSSAARAPVESKPMAQPTARSLGIFRVLVMIRPQCIQIRPDPAAPVAGG